MRKVKFLLIFILFAKMSFATNLQINPKPEPLQKEARNKFCLSVLYSEKGWGLSGGYFKSVSNTSDLFINFSVAGATDNREFEYYDYFGNSYIDGKINRVFMLPLSIGLQHYIFKDDIEKDFKPFVNIGVSPTLILINPYDKGYFKAMGYFHSAFAVGGFVGVGMEFLNSKNLAFSINCKYNYLPVVSGNVMSLQNHTIDDLGGIQLIFGVNFLK
jgi:hypothetical protein